MARPRKFDREDILNRMKLAFWENGYNDISMDDVGRITNLNRGSIYNAFGDKRALYLEALELYGQQHYGAAVELIQQADNTPTAVQQLYEGAFKSMKDDQARWGCFMCNAAVEVAPADPEVAIIVKKYIATLSKAFLHSLQKSYPTANTIKYPKNIAEQLTSSYIGFNVMARTGMTIASLRRISDASVEVVTA
ncbi:TetR/AcrR family transcriptional regulator [Granulosicoccus antarcticus]|uniref:HTH-type transcriptional repressor ComR n=1 Tax=Granulosicoccus antarcticus IMCC3135 TaxID=1192854 RepID=A0A2Z2NWA9_9GAMM|nr:TetR/AcrR family transcriptional regulator [Granulosicoccus antarcticus]ASJ71987.1 HTH-type transcriptional repressor ComR [Granulosicoccus antarcticus IMCC3135]